MDVPCDFNERRTGEGGADTLVWLGDKVVKSPAFTKGQSVWSSNIAIQPHI